jgi:PAS domain S-box-containing protein
MLNYGHNQLKNPQRGPGSRILTQQEDILLLKSDERFRLMIENLQQYAIITIDLDGNVQSWDGGATKLLQYTAEEAVGMHASIFFTEHDVLHHADTQEMDDARNFGHAEDDRWHRRKDGSVFWGSGVMTSLMQRRAPRWLWKNISRPHYAYAPRKAQG